MEKTAVILIFKLITLWLLAFWFVYYQAKKRFKESSLNWEYFQEYHDLGVLFSMMKRITIYVPILTVIGVLVYLFINL